MLVLGIDPGAMKTGLAWIREKSDGVIQRAVFMIKCNETFPFRYAIFQRKLEAFFKTLPEPPIAVAIEEPEHRERNAQEPETLSSILHLEGIYAACASEVLRTWNPMRLLIWKPRVWRKIYFTKKDVAESMGKLYHVSFKSDDESDALGIADYAWRLMKRRSSRQAIASLGPVLEHMPASDEPLHVVAPPEDVLPKKQHSESKVEEPL